MVKTIGSNAYKYYNFVVIKKDDEDNEIEKNHFVTIKQVAEFLNTSHVSVIKVKKHKKKCKTIDKNIIIEDCKIPRFKSILILP